MRETFAPVEIGKIDISQVTFPKKNLTVLDQLLRALKELYKNATYRNRLQAILEKHLLKDKAKTGRNGMFLW